MNKLIRTGLAGAALALAVSGATAQERGSASDPQIQAQIEHRLVEEGIRGATVAVREGMVTLSGSVASAWARDGAIEQARKVAHVEGALRGARSHRRTCDRRIAGACGRT